MGREETTGTTLGTQTAGVLTLCLQDPAVHVMQLQGRSLCPCEGSGVKYSKITKDHHAYRSEVKWLRMNLEWTF